MRRADLEARQRRHRELRNAELRVVATRAGSAVCGLGSGLAIAYVSAPANLLVGLGAALVGGIGGAGLGFWIAPDPSRRVATTGEPEEFDITVRAKRTGRTWQSTTNDEGDRVQAAFRCGRIETDQGHGHVPELTFFEEIAVDATYRVRARRVLREGREPYLSELEFIEGPGVVTPERPSRREAEWRRAVRVYHTLVAIAAIGMSFVFFGTLAGRAWETAAWVSAGGVAVCVALVFANGCSGCGGLFFHAPSGRRRMRRVGESHDVEQRELVCECCGATNWRDCWRERRHRPHHR